MRILLSVVFLSLSAAVSSACTSFLLENGKDLYFVHSLNQGSTDRITGAAYINPRGAWKEGYSFAALFNPADESGPGLVWRSEYGSVTFSPVGKEMPDGGLNEAGLFIWEMGFDTRYPQEEQIPTLFQMQWMQYQLDNYSTVDEVLDNLDRVTLDGWGWHYFVADKSGGTAVIDFPDGRAEVFTGGAMPVPVCGNSYYPEAIRWLEQHEGFGGDLEYRRDYSEIPRFITGAMMLEEYAGQDPVPFCFDVLQAMSVNVRWSVVFDVRRRIAYFNTNVDQDVRHFSFNPEDFTPGNATLMLDIDTPGPGDVRDHFVPFTVGADVQLVQQILELIAGDGTDVPALAAGMIDRLNPAVNSARDGIAGKWQGTLSVAEGEESREFSLIMDLSAEAGELSGTIECEFYGATMHVRNPEFHGGLLQFVTEISGNGDRLSFQLHRTADGVEGFVQRWDWENREKGIVRLSPAVARPGNN